MSIISQETWEKFTEGEKKNIRKIYQTLRRNKDAPLKTDLNEWYTGRVVELEELFDKENLQPKPKIRTWEDLEKLFPEDGFCVGEFEKFADNPKVILKCQATLKISKLIELGYGGIVTEEEWKDFSIDKFCLDFRVRTTDHTEITIYMYNTTKHFIAFHTRQQAEEFMSYPKNRKLVEQYYMI